ncbi:hypothetical protein Agub_g48 [Astrephomene gubernaculifera]|uniref:Uncharacterized protein n=1 Tax=Astrephomene gubernaculifera TaxID=47775 RepID=A0AAD3HGB0_9CHLO|nr:hypothetical protein Agub_g48 [Astrephomene gubernaculifera]
MSRDDMKQLPIYVVDAFSSRPFSGNPAAVCMLATGVQLTDDMRQRIAAEMNHSETAFVEPVCPSLQSFAYLLQTISAIEVRHRAAAPSSHFVIATSTHRPCPNVHHIALVPIHQALTPSRWSITLASMILSPVWFFLFTLLLSSSSAGGI